MALLVVAGFVGLLAFGTLFIVRVIRGTSKKAATIGMIVCFVLVIIGAFGAAEPAEKDKITADDGSGQSQQTNDRNEKDGYVSAPKVIYTTTAEENGHGDANMYVDGIVDRIFTYEGASVCELTTNDGKLALMSIPLLTPSSEWGKLEDGKAIRAYFQYLGYSEVLDEASGALISVGEPDSKNLPSTDGSYVSGTPIESAPEEDGDGVWSERFTPINDFTYTLDKNNKTITLSRYRGHDKKIRLSPTYTIGGEIYSLVSMGDSACFLGEISITSVYIPEGVTHINNNTFNSCSNLQYLYIPSTVQTLDSSFFGYLHEYTAYCDSVATLPGERDMNDYEEIVDDTSEAEELGRSFGGAVNGFLSGLLSDPDSPVVTEIYYGGTEEQWRNITK